jgi:tetratricopeptide (TPR) repeat protein
MPKIHPKPEVLDGLIQLVPEAESRLLRHIQVCAACRGRLEAAGGPARGSAGSNVLSWPVAATEHGRAVDLVLASLRPRLMAAVREQAAAPVLLSELLEHRPERRELLVRNSERFQNLPLCRLLLQRGYRDTFNIPQEGERLARLALGMVGQLDSAWYGERMLADARARCWMVIGNARRVASDLEGAGEAFGTASAILREGTGDPVEKAQLLTYKACLRRAQRRLDEAAGLFRRAVSIFLSSQETQRAAEAVAGLALTEQYRGEPEKASRLLKTATGLLDPQEDPDLYLALCFNRLLFLVDAGRPLEARRLLERNPGLVHPADEARLLRLRWLEARIAIGLGEWSRGVALLVQVRKGFIRRENGYNAAVVTLELATVHRRLGRAWRARRLARQARLLFQTLAIEREALAAFLVLWRTAVRPAPAVVNAA